MLDDVLPAALVPLLDRALRRAREDPAGTVLVGIDGRSGTGKTELAARMARLTGARTLHLDDLYAGWHGLAGAVPVLCAHVVAPLLAGRPGSYRRYDWSAGRWAEQVTVPPGGLLLVEGVGALAGTCAGSYAARVWLEASDRVRRARALARDGAAFAPHWQDWAEQEDRLFADGGARALADVVLDTSRTLPVTGPGLTD